MKSLTDRTTLRTNGSLATLGLCLGLMSFQATAWDADYEETRELIEPATDAIKELHIDAGSGYIKLAGADVDEVRVSAEILVENGDEDEVKEWLDHELNLSLKQKGKRLVLKSSFDSSFGSGFWGSNSSVINLTIEVPRQLEVTIEDGSGSITVDNLGSKLDIDDGSGSITITNVAGPVEIEDGSGSINITMVDHAINVDDGSGSVTVEKVSGDVTVKDGSGSINISDVGGSVSVDDGSGGIYVSDIKGDFVLVDDGSGSLKINEIAGNVSLNK